MLSVRSSREARITSFTLRSTLRSLDSRKFFITCWVMVEAPRTLAPREATASYAALTMPRTS